MDHADATSAPSTLAQLVGSGLIGVREGLETGIVVMILVAFLVKTGRREMIPWATLGVAGAVAMEAAIFLGIHYGTSTVSGVAAELTAGIASMVAVAIVTSMVLWMRTAARSISGGLRDDLTRAMSIGPFAVAGLAFLAVGREGVETALLMVGYAENSAGTSWPLIGLVGGVAIAAVLAVGMYLGAVRVNLSSFFTVTGTLLVVVAAGILAYAVRALQTAGWLPGLADVAFDLSPHFELSSWYGAVLQGVFNMRPDPTVLQVVAWVCYLVVVLSLFLRPHRATAPVS